MAKRRSRRICVVTGSRADYGLLRCLIDEIAADPALTLQVAVTGMHLDARFGDTVEVITADGFAIDARVPTLQAGDDAAAISKATGLGVIGFSDAFARLRPDLVVVLGDRFEIFAAAQAALFARIPVAHLHGGEITEGAVDESMRHAITKLSALHFVAARPYRDRVIQLGESPKRVFHVGAIGLDNLSGLRPLGPAALALALGFAPKRPFFVVTYHPATLGRTPPAQAITALLAALARFPDASILFSGSNADAGHGAITRAIEAFVKRHAQAHLVRSLGQERYLAALRAADVVIGNSSSGIIEAPAAGCVTVNVGDRQRGRLRASSIIDCAETEAAITAAIKRALSPSFRRGLTKIKAPYAGTQVARKIKDIIKRVPLADLAQKRFYDLPANK